MEMSAPRSLSQPHPERGTPAGGRREGQRGPDCLGLPFSHQSPAVTARERRHRKRTTSPLGKERSWVPWTTWNTQRSRKGSRGRPPGDVGLCGPAPNLPGGVGYSWGLDSSCIFGQLLNVGAAMVAWICVLRYLQLQEWGVPKFPNQLCLGTGFLCALGASIVGNFQQTNELSTHLFGSFLAFVVGVAYFWTQLILLRLTKPQTQPGAPWIEPLRLLLCGACTVLMVTMVVLHLWPLRSAAAVCEWSIAMLLFALFGLLAVDFSHLSGFVITLQSRPASCPQSAAHLSSL
ncbi:modulator of macroautophagy TMEM150B isoform X3 [Vombatus ursinus]|uniref:modulator of macroautophagy TMEM150B isoform X3 n=1 Tax=Vombatus ursinus TaxID=29139 RepID=UPI000FFCE5B6|nr:modulator of macroautophagy TMEM150B isoform X3 [Vombatus ursinus]